MALDLSVYTPEEAFREHVSIEQIILSASFILVFQMPTVVAFLPFLYVCI